MSAAAAAFKFIEFQNGITFAPNSLRIKYEASEGTAHIYTISGKYITC